MAQWNGSGGLRHRGWARSHDRHGQEIDILMALPAATLTFSAAFIAEDAGFYKRKASRSPTAPSWASARSMR
jgi:hypothetical protein